MERFARFLPALLAAGLSWACESPGGAGPALSVRDSSGVEIIESRRPLSDSAWRVTAEPITRAGTVSGEDTAQQFTDVRAGVRLSDGRIVVVDGRALEVRWFDARGRHLFTAARRGDGPGEFRVARALFRQPGDTVVLEGGAGIRYAAFGPDGRYVGEQTIDFVRFRSLLPFGECGGITLPDRSHIACRPLAGAVPLPPDPGPGYLRHLSRLVRIPATLDSVVPLGLDEGIEQFGVDVGQKYTYFVVHPFHSRTYMAAGGTPLRIAIVTNPEYSVELWRPDGRLERILRRPSGRRAPTGEERAAAEDELRRRVAGREIRDAAIVDRVVSGVQVPSRLPAAGGLAVAPGGDVLVMREGWLPAQRATLVDVFEARGRWLCTIRLPPRFRFLDVGTDYIMGVRLDENDVPFVEVYGLTRTG